MYWHPRRILSSRGYQCGGLSSSHWGLRAAIDSVLGLAPSIMRGLVGPLEGNPDKQLMVGMYALSTAGASLVCSRHYGANIIVPILFSLPAAIVARTGLGYEVVDCSTVNICMYVSLLIVVILSALAELAASDIGSELTSRVRDLIQSLRHMPRWELALKLMLAKLAIVLLLYTVWTLEMTWGLKLLACIMVVLSVIESPPNAPPSSIISAASIMGTLELIAVHAESEFTLAVTIIGLALFNNVVLRSREEIPQRQALLLAMSNAQALVAKQTTGHAEIGIVNSALAVAQFVWLDPTIFPHNIIPFEWGYLAVATWTLVALRIFLHRQFN